MYMDKMLPRGGNIVFEGAVRYNAVKDGRMICMEYDLSKKERRYYMFPVFYTAGNDFPDCSLRVTAEGCFVRFREHYISRPDGMNEFLLLYCVSGRGTARIGEGDILSVSPGCAVLFPPDIPHEYRSSHDDPWTIQWMHMDGKTVRELYGRGYPARICQLDPEGRRLTEDLFNEMLDAVKDILTPERYLYVDLIAGHILGTVFRHALPAEGGNTGHTAVDRAVSYMQAHIDRQISLEELSRETNYSVSHLTQMFRRMTGMSPIRYYIHMKMQLASRDLYTTDDYIRDIALRYGFDDALYFSRLFRKCFGMSPNRYRAAKRNE